MKKSILLSVSFAFIWIVSFAQQQAPEKVKSAFEQKFANASQVKWEKEKSGEYEASFSQNGKKMSANFSVEGLWMESESEIKWNELPELVKASFIKTYGENQTIKGVAKIEKTNAVVLYEIEYKSGSKTKEVVFDSEGKLK